MEYYSDPILLREVLAYDSYVGADLTVLERVFIHQHIALGIEFKAILLNKIDRIAKTIKKEQWNAPKCRYKEYKHNATIVLEVYNPDKEIWQIYKNPKQ
jgi:hypothetical protein